MQRANLRRAAFSRTAFLTVAAVAGATLGWGIDAKAETNSSRRNSPIVLAIQQAEPAVVNIHGRKTLRNDAAVAGDSFKQVNGMGTGMVFDPRGYILTNYHVVEGLGNIHVTMFDQKSSVARLIAHDAKVDLAVIKIDAEKPLPTLRMGTSSDLMVGESVIALGNPYGYGHSATRGIISRLHRPVQVTDTQRYSDLIQTDAPTNPGNSGGPLMNIDGETIGMTVAVRVGAQGIAFAIPIDEVLEIAGRLVNIERIDQHRHGAIGETRSDDGAWNFVVKEVESDSPAERAGLQSGDKVVSVDGTTVGRKLDFEMALLGRDAGEAIAVEVERDGVTQSVDLKLEGSTSKSRSKRSGAVAKTSGAGARSTAAPRATTASTSASEEERVWDSFGVRLEPVDEGEFRKLKSKFAGGMRVVSVRDDGPAAQAKIGAGDILVGIHIWSTTHLDDLIYVLEREDVDQLQPMRFYVLRKAETRVGNIRIAKRD